MDFESKIISREVSQLLWEMEKTVGTAESCTGGRIAEAIIAVPGASKYFKGGVISYVDEIKQSLLAVDADVLAEKTAVCEEVAIQMVKGACKTLNTDYAIACRSDGRHQGNTRRYHLAGLRQPRQAGHHEGGGRPWPRHQPRHCYQYRDADVPRFFEIGEREPCGRLKNIKSDLILNSQFSILN